MDHPVNPYASPTSDAVSSSEATIRQHRSLRLIGIGLFQIFWGYTLLLIGASLATIGIVVLEVGRIYNSSVWIILGVSGMCIAAASVLVLMIGHVFCLAIPGERRARGWIVLSAVFQMAGLLSVGCMIESPPLMSFCGLLAVAGLVAFSLFVVEVAQFIGRTELRNRSKRVLLAIVVFLMIMFIVSGLAFSGLVDDRSANILARRWVSRALS